VSEHIRKLLSIIDFGFETSHTLWCSSMSCPYQWRDDAISWQAATYRKLFCCIVSTIC